MKLKWVQEQHVRKFLGICVSQLPGGLFLKILKYFQVMLNIFEFSHMKEIAESWFVSADKF